MAEYPYDELRDAARSTRAAVEQLAGDGGVLAQMAAGEWDSWIDGPQAEDLAAALLAVGEHVRHWQEVAQLARRESSHAPDSFDRRVSDRLPLNRKERYFTGTVLPAIVSADGFAHLDRLLTLCGLSVSVPPSRTGSQDLQFFTEYGFAESVFTEADRAKFADAPIERDTPDIVLTGRDWLLAIEAKLYDWPDAATLRRQMDRQASLVAYWHAQFGFSAARVRHVALLPQALAHAVGDVGRPIVLWEHFLTAYRTVGPEYWTAVLTEALGRYGELVTLTRSLQFGRNADARLTGAEIVKQHATGELQFTYMGRMQGINGPALAADLADGSWRSREYEVRRGSLDAPNWFPIAAFVAKTAPS